MKKIKVFNNGELKYKLGDNSIRLIPLPLNSNSRDYYPIIKLQTITSISGFVLENSKKIDIDKIYEDEVKRAIDQSINMLETMRLSL